MQSHLRFFDQLIEIAVYLSVRLQRLRITGISTAITSSYINWIGGKKLKQLLKGGKLCPFIFYLNSWLINNCIHRARDLNSYIDIIEWVLCYLFTYRIVLSWYHTYYIFRRFVISYFFSVISCPVIKNRFLVISSNFIF